MKKNSAAGSQPVTRLIWILLTIFFVIIVIHLAKRDFNHDEFEAVHTAWKIQQGEKIFVDFFQHHHPFYYYMLIPVLAIFGQTITAVFAMRLVSLVMLALMLFVTYRLSLTIFSDKQSALISVLLLSGALIFINRAIEIRPDVPQTLLSLASLLMLFNYFEKKRRLNLVISAVFLAAAFIFLQKAVFLIALIGLLLLICAYKKQISFTDVFIYSIALLVSVLPYFVYLVYSGTLSTYVTFNWLLNMKFLHHFTAFEALGYAVLTNTLLCVFYLWGLLKFSKKPQPNRIGWISLALLGSVFLVRAPYKQYFMIVIPLMAIIAANAVWQLFAKRTKWLVAVLMLSTLPPALFLLNRLKENNAAQIEKINYVLSITGPEDFVYDGKVAFNLFRRDIDYFWFSVRLNRALETYQTMTEYNYDIYELIEKFRPKIISDCQIQNIRHEAVASDYIQSDKFENLFIRKNDL